MLARARQNYKTSRMRILRHELRRRAALGCIDWVPHPWLISTEHRPAMAFAIAAVLWSADALAATILPLAACSNDWALCAIKDLREDPACFDRYAWSGLSSASSPWMTSIKSLFQSHPRD